VAKNVGSTDKIIRLIAGIGLLALVFLSGLAIFQSTAVTIVAVVVGIILIGTALINFCPLYRVLGIGTFRT